MKIRRASFLPYLPILFSLARAQSQSSSVTLADFQQIDGFSQSCTSAYNTPIPGCTRADFSSPSTPCSQACANGLRVITTALNSACSGTLTDPTTLIGLFFEGEGVNALCPRIASDSSSSRQSPPATPAIGSPTRTVTQTQESRPTPDNPPENRPDNPPPDVSSMGSITARPSEISIETLQPGPPGSITEDIAPIETVTETAEETRNPTAGPESFGGGAIPFNVGDVDQGAGERGGVNKALLAGVAAIAALNWAVR